MNPLLNLYLRRMMAAQGGRIAFQGGGADHGGDPASGDGDGDGDNGNNKGGGQDASEPDFGPSKGPVRPGGDDASEPDYGQENFGPDPNTDPDEGGGLKNLFTKVVKKVPPTLGFLLAPPPVQALTTLKNIAGFFGVEAGPAPDSDPDQGGRADERVLMTTAPVDPGDPFAGDAIKTQRYKDFMLAGYPPDMAEYLVKQLM
jgi:hypothetical protein